MQWSLYAIIYLDHECVKTYYLAIIAEDAVLTLTKHTFYMEWNWNP